MKIGPKEKTEGSNEKNDHQQETVGEMSTNKQNLTFKFTLLVHIDRKEVEHSKFEVKDT